jgi:hypothetical protein
MLSDTILTYELARAHMDQRERDSARIRLVNQIRRLRRNA